MKKLNNKIKILLLVIVLIVISFVWIVLNGKTYKYQVNIGNNISNLDEIEYIIEPEGIIECIDKKINDGILELKIKSVKEGKTHIEIRNKDNFIDYHTFYVHKAGIITYNNYLGDTTGGRIIPISVTILLSYILYIAIKKYKILLKENMYQYNNIAYLGFIIFLVFSIITQFLSLLNYNNGLIGTVRQTLGTFTGFSIFLLPIAFIVSILVIYSNIVLVRKEGMSWKNLLGLILGFFLCFSTILPDIVNNFLQTATFVDVHRENGIASHIQMFCETTVYSIVTYLECILVGTIVLGIKSAKHIPEFNKNYIIILGCQIKKDGSLTNLLKSRVDRAIEFRNMQKDSTGKDLIFVPSGGKGQDEVISEAQAMKNYLITQGIEEKDILIEDKSKNTYENIKFSNEIIKTKNKDAKIAFSTTNYHVFRAGIIGTKQNVKVEGIGAKTKTYFWTNAFIREFIATLYSEKKKHISIMLGITLGTIIMVGLVYVSNIIV